MARHSALVVSFLAAWLLAGCGQTPTAVTPQSEPSPEPMPSMVPVAPAAGDEGPRLLAGLRQAFLSCKGIQAEVSSYSEGHFKAGKRVSELRTNTSTSSLIWAKPNRMRGEVLQTDNFLTSGARMVSTDGKSITVRAGGVLGILPITVSSSDHLLASNRDHRFCDMTPNALLQWIMGPTAVWTVMGDGQVKGTPVKLIRVSAIKHLDGEITEERLAIDPTTFAVRNLAMYAGTRKVVDYTFVKFKWNPTVTADTFKL